MEKFPSPSTEQEGWGWGGKVNSPDFILAEDIFNAEQPGGTSEHSGETPGRSWPQ